MRRRDRRAAAGGTAGAAAGAAAVLLIALLGGCTSSVTPTASPATPAAPPSAQGRAVPEQVTPSREQAVQALLDDRAEALLARDRAGFLAGVDPLGTAFRHSQGELFDALAAVPLAAWTYRLDTGAQPAEGAGTTWAPRVLLGVALAGVDATAAEYDQGLFFVERGGRWWVAGQDEAGTRRQIWDGGPVEVVRGRHSLVLGHPGSDLARLAEDIDAAVPRVTAVWGAGWAQQVAVLVPADEAELAGLVTARGSLGPIAALAVSAPLAGGGRGGDRVVVSPANLATLDDAGRRVVLTHEVTHVATRAATTEATPLWLSEGLADHVGLLGAGVPLRVAAQELRAEVRAGRVPDALPADSDFSGDNPRIAQAYESAWLAVESLVDRHGQERVLALYREVGRAGSDLDQSLAAVLGTDLATVTTQWQAALRERLG